MTYILLEDGKSCTAENPCGHYEGNCNFDNDCEPRLKCGMNNCPAFLGYAPSVDCCFKCSCMMVEVFHATETQEYTFQPEIFGCYIKSSEIVNGRDYYTSIAYNGNYGIWWAIHAWIIGRVEYKGQQKGFAYNTKNVICLPEYIDWNWYLAYQSGEVKYAGQGLEVKCGVTDGATNGDLGFCSACNLCGENEGDCKNDNQCQKGLKCGQGNCPASFGVDTNCCYKKDECYVFETLVENVGCPYQLTLTIYNDAAKYKIFEGTYILNDGKVNGKSYWSGPDSNAIWYINDFNVWVIGSSQDLGSSIASLFLDFIAQCPHQGNGKWKYTDGFNWLDAGNDVQITIMDTGPLSKLFLQIQLTIIHSLLRNYF